MAGQDNDGTESFCPLAGNRCIAALIFIAVVVAAAVTIVLYGPSAMIRWWLQFVPGNPGWEWYIGMGLATLVSIVMLMPIWPPMCMASGLIFGIYHGSLLNFVVVVSASIISLSLGRLFLREPIRGWLEKQEYPQLQRMLLILEDEDNALKFQVLFRFLFIPLFVRNYGPSTLEIPLWKLCLSTLPHSAWVAVLFASLGATFKDVAELLGDRKQDVAELLGDRKQDHHAFTWQQLLLLAVSVAIALVLSIYAHRKYSERLHRDEETLAIAST